MNEIINYINNKYFLNLNISKVKKITSSNNNEVFDLGKLILKISNKKYNLKNEFDILNLIKGNSIFPKAILYDNLLKKYFILIEKINGKTLDNHWLNYSENKKEEVLENITKNLQFIHSLHNEKFIDFVGGKKIIKNNYFDILNLKLSLIKEKAFQNKYVDINRLNNLLCIFEKNKHVFDFESPFLVHNDLWYKNILGNKKGFTSIIDFETSIFAPKQVELFKIYNHLISAKNYFENNPLEYKELDFLNKFIKYLKVNYKELFNYNNKQKLLFDIVIYFTILSKYKEKWYNHNETEKFGIYN